MGSMFKKPKVPPPPPVPPPPAMPEVDDKSVKKAMRKRKGRGATVVAGDLVPENIMGQKTVLG